MNTQKDKFLAFISHKLLAPATIIKWNAELLNKEVKKKDYKMLEQRISDMIKSNNKQIDFVNKFLNELGKSDNLSVLESDMMSMFKKKDS